MMMVYHRTGVASSSAKESVGELAAPANHMQLNILSVNVLLGVRGCTPTRSIGRELAAPVL